MRDLRSEVLELFAEFESDEPMVLRLLQERQRKAAYHAEYDAERAKKVRCVPALKAKRKEQAARYERKRWQRTKADARALERNRARRRAAHAKLKADPVRLAAWKTKQAVHSANHAARKRASRRREAA